MAVVTTLLTAQGRWGTGVGPGHQSQAEPGAHRRQDDMLWGACLGPPPASRLAHEICLARAGRKG